MPWKSKEEQLRVASMGGKAAQAKATAHRFKVGSEEARAAGLKGGLAYKAKMEKRKQLQKSFEWAQIHNAEAKLTLEEVAEFGPLTSRETIDGVGGLEGVRKRRAEEAAKLASFRKTPLAETNVRMGREHLAALDAEDAP